MHRSVARSPSPHLLAWLAGAWLVFAARHAHADPVDAEALFRDAKRDISEGRFDAACPKFEESYRASSVAGALLSWADCEERRGRDRLALELWKMGEARVADDPDRLAYVRQRRATVEAKLAAAKPPDRVPAPSAQVGPRTSAAAEPRRPTPPPRPDDPGATLALAGFVVGGIGAAAGLAFAGTGAAVVAECADTTCPPSYQGLLITNAALGAVALAALGTGAVLLGVGLTRDHEERASRVFLLASPTSLSITGTF